MYDELINIVYDYIYKMGVDSFESFSMSFNCSNVLLEERKFKYKYKYKKKYDFNKVDSMVEDFLINLNPSYLEYYRLRKNDGSFIFKPDKSGYGYSSFDYETGDHEIYVGITGYIEDAFTIVHELFHDINVNDDCDSYGRYFFTECLSMLGEFLFSDYLVDKNIVDRKNVIEMMLYFLRGKALEVNFNLRLIQEYFQNGYLDSLIIDDIINSYPSEYRKDIDEIISIICDQEWITLEDEQTYILSCLCATYMYDRIKEKNKYINELFDLNQVLNDFSLSQVLDYLDLEHGDFDLTDKSYSILRDKYKKFIKRWQYGYCYCWAYWCW